MFLPHAPVKPFRVNLETRATNKENENQPVKEIHSIENVTIENRNNQNTVEETKMSNLNTLYTQMNKINNWKFNKEKEYKDLEEQISKANNILENQKKSLHDLNNEKYNLVNLLKNEIDSHNIAIKKLDNIRNFCETLKKHTNFLEHKLSKLDNCNEIIQKVHDNKEEMVANFDAKIKYITDKFFEKINEMTKYYNEKQNIKSLIDNKTRSFLKDSQSQIECLEIMMNVREGSAKLVFEKIDKNRQNASYHNDIKNELEKDVRVSEDKIIYLNKYNAALTKETSKITENNLIFKENLSILQTKIFESENHFNNFQKMYLNIYEGVKEEYSVFKNEIDEINSYIDAQTDQIENFETNIKLMEEEMLSANQNKEVIKYKFDELQILLNDTKALKIKLQKVLIELKNEIFLFNDYLNENKYILKENQLLENALRMIDEKITETIQDIDSIKIKGKQESEIIEQLQKETNDINAEIIKKTLQLEEQKETANKQCEIIELLTKETDTRKDYNKSLKFELKEKKESLNKLEMDIDTQVELLKCKDSQIVEKDNMIKELYEKENNFKRLQEQLTEKKKTHALSLKENMDLEKSYDEALKRYEFVMQENKACENKIKLLEMELQKRKLSVARTKSLKEESIHLNACHMKELKQILDNTKADYKKALTSKDLEIEELKKQIEITKQAIEEKSESENDLPHNASSSSVESLPLNQNSEHRLKVSDLKAKLEGVQENYHKTLTSKDAEIFKLQSDIAALMKSLEQKQDANENFSHSIMKIAESPKIETLQDPIVQRTPRKERINSRKLYNFPTHSSEFVNYTTKTIDITKEMDSSNVKKKFRSRKIVHFSTPTQQSTFDQDNFPMPKKTNRAKKNPKISPEQNSGLGWFDF